MRVVCNKLCFLLCHVNIFESWIAELKSYLLSILWIFFTFRLANILLLLIRKIKSNRIKICKVLLI